VSSSGGNAGLACATIGVQLGLKVDVVVPTTTKELVIAKLKSLGAHVTVHGENWNQADEYTRAWVAQLSHAAYVSPYDHPLLWTGHSSLVEEILQQLVEERPAAILVSVGGGGLLCGVLEGLERVGEDRCQVVAAETLGASSFGQAWKEQKLVRLSKIDSIATSLGALEVTPEALERGQRHGRVRTSLCTDAEAIEACLLLARDHRVLVEPACGAALATLYSTRLREPFLQQLAEEKGPIVVEVCGGSGVTVDLLMQWKQDFVETKE
jgi:L-serine/L-threonine ammonia-lyase